MKRDSSQTPDLRGFEHSLPIALLRAREAVMVRFRPHLAAHNLTDQQWRVMRALAQFSSMDATGIAERCCILMPSLSRILKSLENDGLIVRTKTESDGRRQAITLTQSGKALFDKMSPVSAAIYSEIEQACGLDSIDTLIENLNALQVNLE